MKTYVDQILHCFFTLWQNRVASCVSQGFQEKENVNIQINKLPTSMLLILFSVMCEIPV